MNDLRIRLEGSLEVVETACVELEQSTIRLHTGIMASLGRVLHDQHLLQKARADVERFASTEPSLVRLLKRLDKARRAFDAEVRQQSAARGLADTDVQTLTELLEKEQVFFTGEASWPLQYVIVPALVVAAGGVMQLPSQMQVPAMFGTVAIVPLAIGALARLLPPLRVSTLCLRIGRERISLSELGRVELSRLRKRSCFATIIDVRGARRKPVKLWDISEAFLKALADAGIKVNRV